MSSSSEPDFVPVTQRQTDRFTERNTVLYALLGLVSFSRRAEALALALAVGASREGGGPRQEDPSKESERAVVEAALGLISLGRQVRGQVESWAAASPPARQEAGVAVRRFPGLSR